MLKQNIIIFTDLDGTLLDHDTYSFEAAQPMLDVIRTYKIPLIIVTSKTKDEVILLQDRLDIKTPFIVENGGGAFIRVNDGYESIRFGFDYTYIRSCFIKYSESIPMQGFFRMSIEEICAHTGLKPEQAGLAKERLFTEPFLLENKEDLPRLEEMADKDGLEIVRGGRFYHLITKGQDKARAVKRLIEYYEKRQGCDFITIALGDSENDVSMLNSVDVPILIPHKDGSYIDCPVEKLRKAVYPGPKGWNRSLMEYLDV